MLQSYQVDLTKLQSYTCMQYTTIHIQKLHKTGTKSNQPVEVLLENMCRQLTEQWTAAAPGEARSRSPAACDACDQAEWTNTKCNHDATAAAAAPSVTCPATQPHRQSLLLYLYTHTYAQFSFLFLFLLHNDSRLTEAPKENLWR